MNRIDKLHPAHPFAGARMLRDMLRLEGFDVGRVHVSTLMRKMGVEALYRKPGTTLRHPAHRIYPYLLRDLNIYRPNQVWAMDITYMPMAKGFVYLTVVLDWHTRRVLSHRVSNTMDVSFCLDTVAEAIQKYGTPDIMNTDQGSQFTGDGFIGLLKDNEIEISMDGKDSWRDNVFVERLWRSVKYEEVYLHAYASIKEARNGIGKYLQFYNSRRPHSSLDRQVPDQVYFNGPSVVKAA